MILRRIALGLSILFFCCGGQVWAHAILMGATPAANQLVARGSTPVKLRFNSRIDGKRSALSLLAPDGSGRALAIVQPAPDTLTATTGDLTPGYYVLQWQVLAEDGHISRGEMGFRVQ